MASMAGSKGGISDRLKVRLIQIKKMPMKSKLGRNKSEKDGDKSCSMILFYAERSIGLFYH